MATNSSADIPLITYVEENLTFLYIFSAIICIFGTGSNLLAFFLSRKKKNKEKSGFSLLVEISSMLSAVNCASGFVVLNA